MRRQLANVGGAHAMRRQLANVGGGVIAGLVIGVIVLLVCVGYCIYRFFKNMGDLADGGGGGDGGGGTANPAAKNRPAVATELAASGGWTEHKDDSGDVFYYNEETGETSWDRPPGHTRVGTNGTVIPPGWNKHKQQGGDDFYEAPDGSTQYERPPQQTQ